MRNHGWHLPYHPLQIVAVAVFSALAFSFYVFFVPFVGSSVVRFHVIAAFSPVVFAVFVLYVRCAAIDPADSGIKAAMHRAAATKKIESSADILLQESERHKVIMDQVEIDFSGSTHLATGPETDGWEKAEHVCNFLCCPVVGLWRCIPGTGLLRSFFLGKKTNQDKYIPDEELLYCSLCEAEILKTSKHCRACDKCVDGFDHHCRWLNNCIGKKNYKTFIAVMVASLLMLVLEWSIGISVLVRCFSDPHKFDKERTEKLGSSFTRIPFIVVVTLCTFLALLATLPLTQLLFFHIILIKKGITTYDYIVAIREQETQEPTQEGHLGRSPSSSPTSSIVTAMSAGSSSGGLHRAVWCTPPRIFVENQANMKAEVVSQHSTPLRGSLVRTDLGNDGGISSRQLKEGLGTKPKRQIGLSPWKLARLSGKDAARAAIRARENSSILRPVKCVESPAVTETEDSSFEISDEISTVHGGHKVGWRLEVPSPHDSLVGHEHQNPLYSVDQSTNVRSGGLCQRFDGENGHAIIPLGSEARSPFRSRSLNTLTSFPVSATESPDNLASPDLLCGDLRHQNGTSQERSCLYRATSDGYEASGGESADDTSDHGYRLSQAWSKLKLNPSFFGRGDAQNAAAKWSSESEDVVALQSQLDSRASSTCETRSNGSRVEAHILRHVRKDWPGIRDKISTSTEGSNNSSPSYLVSPIHGMSPDIHSGFESHIDSPLERSSSRDSSGNVDEAPLAGESFKPLSSKRGSSSGKRLKETLLSYRRGLSPSAIAGGALLSSTP